MPEIAYVNGEFVPLERAMVHVEDRGFQFADSVYEVIRTYGGRPYAVVEHLARLQRSLDAIELPCPVAPAALTALVEEGVRRAAFPEAQIYLQVTRGPAPRHRGFPRTPVPTLVITVRKLSAPDPAKLQRGIKLITVPDQRWARCDIKSVALLANVLAYQAAHAAGADDAVFVDTAGLVAESTAGNIFLITRGELATPPTGPRLLAGVTRAKFLAAARNAGLPCTERDVHESELRGADEVFLTSTTAEMMPVVSINGQPVGTGRPGPVARRVHEEFRRLVQPAKG